MIKRIFIYKRAAIYSWMRKHSELFFWTMLAAYLIIYFQLTTILSDVVATWNAYAYIIGLLIFTLVYVTLMLRLLYTGWQRTYLKDYKANQALRKIIDKDFELKFKKGDMP